MASRKAWAGLLLILLMTSCSMVEDYAVETGRRVLRRRPRQPVPTWPATITNTAVPLKKNTPSTGSIDQLFYEGGLVNPFNQEFVNHNSEWRDLINETSCVELSQPFPDILLITVWGSRGDDKVVLRKKTLSARQGDFSCDQEGLHLAPCGRYFVTLLENSGSRINRTLSKTEDGCLVLKFEIRLVGNSNLIIPVIGKKIRWYKWDPCKIVTP